MASNLAKALPMATLLGSLLLSACSVFGIRSGTEEPAHGLVERLGDVEIRRYAPRTAAETPFPGMPTVPVAKASAGWPVTSSGATRAASAST